MATSTKASVLSNARTIGENSYAPSTTSVDEKPNDNAGSYLARKYAPSTTPQGTTQEAGAFFIKKFTDAETPATHRQLEENNLRLPGTILEIDDVSIVCEILSQGESKHIRFQRSLFPDSIRYGMAIWIGIDESSGIRRPVVLERDQTLGDKQLKDENAEMDSLVEKL